MAFQLSGSSGTVADVGGTVFRALKMTSVPLDYGSLGIYRKSLLSGTMAAGLAANSEVFHFRWADATRVCVIQSIQLDGLSGSATAFAAGFGKIDVVPARAWTADGSGGIAGTMTGNNGKMRTSMSTTLGPTIRIASTTNLVAGTKALDVDPIGQISLSFGTATSIQYVNQIGLLDEAAHEMPLVLANQEGFVLRATVPATGTWQFGVTVLWAEVNSY